MSVVTFCASLAQSTGGPELSAAAANGAMVRAGDGGTAEVDASIFLRRVGSAGGGGVFREAASGGRTSNSIGPGARIESSRVFVGMSRPTNNAA